jgi:hypothetical protein
VNALAVIYVNEHLQTLLDEAAQHAPVIERPSLKARRSLAMPIDNRGTIIPKLSD